VQLRYSRSSMGRFVTESARLAELTARIAAASLRPMQETARQSMSEMSERTRP
jgi:hypothetical protein